MFAKHPVIGISGRARSGKDTVASFMVPFGGYQYGFADPIRQMLLPLGIDMRSDYWQSRKEEVIAALGVSPRRMMQTLGTEWGRQLINKDLWLILAQQELLRLGPGMVVSDVRFENEAEWVRRMGGRIIHLDRPQAKSVESHASEAGVKREPGDIVIHNTGSLAELQQKVTELFQ
jgi:dephospho-CoA kinase